MGARRSHDRAPTARFASWQQLPFACSYVPGKRSLAGILSAYLVVLVVVVPLVSIVVAVGAAALPLFPIYLGGLGAAWLTARHLRREGLYAAKLQYEDSTAVPDLGIRDMSYGPRFDGSISASVQNP